MVVALSLRFAEKKEARRELCNCNVNVHVSLKWLFLSALLFLSLALSLSLSAWRRIDRTVIALSRIPFCDAAVLERRARSYAFGTH